MLNHALKHEANSWNTYKFGECAKLINGRAYSQHELLATGDYQVIRIQNLNGGPNWYYSDLHLDEEKYCEQGDLLFAWSATFGPYVWNGPKAIFHYHIWNVKPNPDLLDKDFAYFLLLWITEEIRNGAHGIAMLHFTKEGMESFDVSIPSLPQQRQIAARLKAQLAEVDKARQAAEAQLRDASLLVARYREKTIKQLEDVPRVPLGELLHGIEAGKSFQTTELIACPDELGVLKVSAVSWNEFLPQEAKAVEGEYQPDERHKIKKGDLIISRANTLELVGAVVRVADDYPMRLLSDKTLRLVVNEEMVLPDYLLTVLKLPEARSHIENNATGTSDSMRNISQKTINSIPVPVLTFDQQRELINRFSQFNEEMALVQKSGKAMLNDINLLPQKILAQAFEV